MQLPEKIINPIPAFTLIFSVASRLKNLQNKSKPVNGGPL
jgi:hypothetical protein